MSEESKDGTDKRRATRFAIWFPMRIETHGDVIMGISRDVSEVGVALVAAAEPRSGAKVNVTLRLPTEDSERVVEGTIVRVSQNEADTEGLWRYKVAVAFDEAIPQLEPVLEEVARATQPPPEP